VLNLAGLDFQRQFRTRLSSTLSGHENGWKMTSDTARIRCAEISYRQGFIEVSALIHDEKINIETWHVNPETDISNCNWVDDLSIPDSDIVSNCELELSINDARILANSILKMID